MGRGDLPQAQVCDAEDSSRLARGGFPSVVRLFAVYDDIRHGLFARANGFDLELVEVACRAAKLGVDA